MFDKECFIPDFSRIRIRNCRILLWIEFPILRPLEEIYFLVSGPNKGGVNVAWDTRKARAEVLRIAPVQVSYI